MPTRPTSNVLVLVCMAASAVRDQVLAVFTSDKERPIPTFCPLDIESIPLAEAELRLAKHYQCAGQTGALIVSDELLETVEDQVSLSPDGRELVNRFEQQPFAMIAVSDRGERVTDVDRVVRPADVLSKLESNVCLCLERLAYLSPPTEEPLNGPVEIRPLRHEHEFRDYFTQRHTIYRAMCYLSRRMEENKSGMEVDWFDTRSAHIGAFMQFPDGHTELVGTGRLITNAPTIPRQLDLVLSAIDRDAFLSQRVENGAITAQLPVLQSQGLVVLGVFGVCGELIVGELSRITVRRNCRGRGISGALVKELIKVATEQQVADLLLECLPSHEQVYLSHDFRLLPHVRGNVYGINRTMIVMHRQLGVRSALVGNGKQTVSCNRTGSAESEWVSHATE